MRSAFPTTKSAAAFGLLLLIVLLLPILVGKAWLPPREEIYATPSLVVGNFSYIKKQIYIEKVDLDIAFVGSSHIGYGIYTPYVQAELSKRLGRNTTVASLAWYGAGFDSVYFITKDLLANRKVHLLVITDEYNPRWPIPHMAAPRWFLFGDDWADLMGLPLVYKAGYYAAALRGIPRNILSVARPNLPMIPHSWDKATERLGAFDVPLGFGPEDKEVKGADFVEYTPTNKNSLSDVCVYSSVTKDQFAFSGLHTPTAQFFFLKKLVALAQTNGVKLVWLHSPKVSELRAPAVPERECWPKMFPGAVTLMGIPPKDFLAGISDTNVLKLFCNDSHLNNNGQKYFTRAITPTLLKLYAP